MALVGQGSAPPAQIAQFRSDGITAATGLRIPFFTDAFARSFGFPQVLPVNMLIEETPLREERPFAAYVGLREVHYSRPGLVGYRGFASGPVRGVWKAPLAFGGGLIVVCGQEAYYGETGQSLGTIPGSDLARFAASEQQMVIVADGQAFVSTGGDFAPIVSAVLPPVSDVAWLGSRFVYLAAGTDTFWYSEIDDGTNILGLDFATAEQFPDPNVAFGVLNDGLVIFGAWSTEFWQVSSDLNAPYTPTVGNTYRRGCIARDTVRFADNALIWVGDDLVVYRTGQVPTRISSSSIEDAIRRCADPTTMTALVLQFEGHELYVLNIPGVGSYAYDFSRIGTQAQAYGDSYQRGEWQEWRSWGADHFRGQVGCMLNGVAYVGDDTLPTLWTMQMGVYDDAGGPLERGGSCFIKVEEGTPRCLNLVLHGVLGTGNATEPGQSPVVEMRWSDDQGRTFTPWRAASLGAQGQYRNRPFWQRLGLLRAPGRLVQVRCTDPVNFALSHMELNAVGPAR